MCHAAEQVADCDGGMVGGEVDVGSDGDVAFVATEVCDDAVGGELLTGNGDVEVVEAERLAVVE